MGEVTDNCGLNAQNHPVTTGATHGDNSRCGRDGLDDGFCILAGTGTYQCTVPCIPETDQENPGARTVGPIRQFLSAAHLLMLRART